MEVDADPPYQQHERVAEDDKDRVAQLTWGGRVSRRLGYGNELDGHLVRTT